MAVPGRKAESHKYEQSEELSALFCQSCNEDGHQLPAEGFCVDCCEYLCEECFKHHHRPRQFKHHVLQDRKTMPRNKPLIKASDMTGDRCISHQGEKIKFYCGSHDHFGCATCIAVDHRNCEGVSYVEQEYKELSKKLTDLYEQVVSNERHIEETGKSIEQYYSDAVASIGQFRKEINDLMDRLEHDITDQAKTIKDEDQTMMTAISTKMDEMKCEIKATIAEFNSLYHLDQNRKLFAIIDKTKDKINRLDKNLIQMQNEHATTRYQFEAEKQLKDLLGNLKTIGNLSVINRSRDNTSVLLTTTTESKTTDTQTQYQQQQQHQQTRTTQTEVYNDSKLTQTEYPTDSKLTQTEYSMDSKITQTQAKWQNTNRDNFRRATHISDINVRSSSYRMGNPAGLTLLPDNQLVVATWRTGATVLVNMRNNTITSEIRPSSSPWDVTMINNSKVAVTLPDACKVQLVSVVSQSLSVDRDIKVNGACRGIVYNYGTLIVTFINPGKVEIINMSGDVLRSMEKNASGVQLFERPQYIVINPDKTVMYVSDYNKHSVTCMTLNGKVKAVYKDDSLKQPEGLVTDRTGTVYVCGYGSNNIHQITAECTKIQILLDQKRGISKPQSITYCDKEEKLYVGVWETRVVKTFQLR